MPPGAMNLGATWTSLRGQWQALPPNGRRNILATAVAAVAGILLLAVLAARGPAMAALFTNLAPVDGAAIVTQLGRDKVPYKLANNGQTILVPQSQVDKLRLQMAGLGLPKSGSVGLSSVLSLPFGATDFTRQVAYQNALQGELEQTINQIGGVAGSRVQIVLPQQATFSGQSNPASAAVLVKLQPGITLSAGQVRGIANLVAASVQGLSPNAVTVLDQTGQILWAQGATGLGVGGGNANGPTGQAENQFQLQQQFDQTLQTNLQHLLQQVFGPGNVVTQVQAQLNFNSGTVDRTLFLPKGSGPAVVKSMQQLKQTVLGTPATGGVPGTASNSFPTYPAGAGGKTSSTSNQLTQNFDISQETQHTVIAPGSVSRLSVAVVVNSPLNAAQLALVRATVQAAVGADPARQDQITVVGLPFNHSLVNALSQPLPARALPIPEIAAGAALLLILLVLLLFRRRGGQEPAVPDEAALGGETLSSPAAFSVAGPGPDGLGSAIASAQAARERLNSSLRQRPEDVARVVRVWLEQSD